MKNGLSIDEFGNKFWYEDDFFHRVDGPAVEYTSGTKHWFQNGKLHRIDGPAIEWDNGNKSWWIKGEQICSSSQQEFEQLLKMKAFW